MLHITESAAEQLRSLAAERALSDAEGLRLSIEKGGCAGLQYGMEVGGKRAGDEVCEEHGARVFVEDASREHLDGCTLDYADDLTGAGFRIVNPRAVRSCGCGTSFEPAAHPH
ncbi:MAG: iron-sulfur cluster assembly accessory protein [Terrimicrobiaceae bacterium]|nr:iron-sulfur cluster assembly accessory protein [Terrimicrobiaceae bacterium]